MQFGPQYRADILVGTGWLREYDTHVSRELQTVECYVCSEANEAFSLWFQNTSCEDLHLRLYMDGIRLGAWTTSFSPCVKLSGIRISPTEKKQFFFSSGWQPSEEYDVEKLTEAERKRWNERGSIKLEVYKIKAQYSDITPVDARYHQGPKQELDTVRFEVKKEGQSNTRAVRDFQWDENYGKRPLATFVFRHRPHDWLEQYGFISSSQTTFNLDLSALSISESAATSIVTEMKRLNMADQDRKEANRQET